MIIILILIAFAAFLLGFSVGNFQKYCENSFKVKKREAQILKLRREYENFLNYDGTEQE